jgi:acylphosphatase
MPTPAVRLSVYYSGRVQGVGFRYTARQVARNYALTGFVRNLPDRRVELVVEGDANEVQRFIDAVGESMRDNIRDTAVNRSTPTGEFSNFEIRH